MGTATGLRPAPLLAGVAAAGVLVASVLTGPEAGADVRTGRVTVGYTCAYPGGAVDLAASLVQDYPTAAAPGSPLRPGPLTVETTLPRGLLPAGTTTVTGTAALQVSITRTTAAAPAGAASTATAAASGAASARSTLVVRGAAAGRQGTVAEWGGLVVAPAAVGGGVADITATGAVPALPQTGPGTTTVTPMALTLLLHGGSGSVQLSCTPAAPPAPLGSVTAAGPSATTAPSPGTGGSSGSGSGGDRGGSVGSGSSRAASAGATARAGARGAARNVSTPACGASPSGSLDPADLPTPPPGSTVFPPPGSPPQDLGVECAYAIGYANVGKLGEAALVNNPEDHPALASLATVRDIFNFAPPPGYQVYFEADEVGNLTLPSAATTFLTFGFMPTTATMQLVPQGPLTVVATGAGAFYNQPSITTIYGRESLRLTDVRVSGTPLDVGSDCHTVTPVQLKLVGVSNSGLPDDNPSDDYTVTTGGPIGQEQLTIPYFTGCGTRGQNLDALFDAAVSGTGNSLNLVQGPTCFTFDGSPCTVITMPELPRRAPKTERP
ncbi:hypothetical protein GXW83_20560 [Streptacidiphilus sp. PB12-B1b]|uniref:hypothetical protein n=1 Tax=Streptacidiphilus sp. PB12-B1b TaxID=2705012 RepID=UPI0015F98942|nr:hypothetical protein [Streptacidiphilus sp. PB12-B1b]QMU77727.1 hypothetical protein GXW83_20560 [Streptacidiphilus sp. PB12-B1b]